MATRVSVANPYEQPLDFPALKAAATAVLSGEGVTAGKVTLAFVDDPHIHRLNKQFLNHDEPTDVLTFPYTEPGAKSLEGEVVIGYEIAKEYAADRNHEANLELLLYVVHGCLHMCGYTDADAQVLAQQWGVRARSAQARAGAELKVVGVLPWVDPVVTPDPTVEAVDVRQEPSLPHVHLSRHAGVFIVQRLDVPAIFGDRPHCIDPVSQ